MCAQGAIKRFHLAWDTPLQCHVRLLTYGAIGIMRVGSAVKLAQLANSENIFVQF
jgi:hypothetical protein